VTADAAAPVALAVGSDSPLVDRFDTALLDLDGVVYVGPNAVDGVPEALAEVRRRGMRAAFVTNNASRTPQSVAAHLTELGVPAEPSDVVTSAQAAATLLLEHVPAGASVLVVGGEGLHAALRERGLRPVTSADDDPAAVVQGFAPEIGWQDLAEGTYAVRRGLPWIAANLDLTVPTARGIAPGNGSLVGVIRVATGVSPTATAGKPELALHRESMRRSGARRPLVVGDRLDTDIEGANRAGVPSLLVLTGVTGPDELLAADPVHRPTYAAADLSSGLLRDHPPAVEQDGGWSCAGWTVSPGDGLGAAGDGGGSAGSGGGSAGSGGGAAGDGGGAAGVAVSGTGEPIDLLRALCVAVWTGQIEAGPAAAAFRASSGA
jgi:glycerol 3-phosphatase-2